MAKRRTKKQKQKPRRPFLVNKRVLLEPSIKLVKGQSGNKKLGSVKAKPSQKKAVSTDNKYDLGFIKKDLIRSLIIASLILGTEVVLYLSLSW